MSSGLAIDALTDVPDSAPTLSADGSSPDVARVARQAPEVSSSSSTFSATFRSVGEVAAAAQQTAAPKAATEKPVADAAPTPSVDDQLAALPVPVLPVLLEVPDPPQRSDYGDPAAFDAALVQHGAQVGIRRLQEQNYQEQVQRRAAAESHVVAQAWQQQKEAATKRHADFEQVALADALTITSAMAETIRRTANGADIAYHLGTHPDAAKRIAGLDPVSQVAEVAILGHALKAADGVRQALKASAPRTASASKGTPSVAELSRMSTTDYAKWRMGSMSRR